MYGFRASMHLPHLSSSRPDTYLNHRGRTTDPLEKVLLFSAKGKHFPFGVRGPTAMISCQSKLGGGRWSVTCKIWTASTRKGALSDVNIW